MLKVNAKEIHIEASWYAMKSTDWFLYDWKIGRRYSAFTVIFEHFPYIHLMILFLTWNMKLLAGWKASYW